MQYPLLKLSIFFVLLVINLLLSIFLIGINIGDASSHQFSKYFWMIFIYLFIYTYYRLLTKRMVMSMEFTYIEKANFIALIIITLILFASKSSEEYARGIVLLFFGLNITILPIAVYFLKKYFMKYDRFREDILAIFDKDGEADLNSWFVKDNSFGFNVKSKISADGIEDSALKEKIKQEIDSSNYYAVVISLANRETDKTFQAVNYVLHHVSRVFVLPRISRLPLINSEFFNSINHKGMALYVKNKLLHPGERNVKAFFDKTISIFLFIFLLPITIVLYIIVYISTDGEPIYKQRRIGKNGIPFNIYKFRTMKKNADIVLKELLENDPEAKEEWEREFKLKNDPRITEIGHFLRRTSLDELPQLFNVFQGKMSLVGPRPIIADEVAKYGEYYDYFKAVKPGITGLWQVSGRNDISYDERVLLDVWYVRNWSMELDIMILVKTAVIVLARKGSY